MPRPVGRYFASVISKIQGLKSRENIVPDNDFKARLRLQLLAKIQAAPEVPERVSIFERFLRWRYQLAFIPAFLFMVVAVSALRRLPIDFQNKVAAPAPQSAVVQTTNMSNSVNDQSSEESLRTFAGSTVLPPAYFGDATDNSTPVSKENRSPSLPAQDYPTSAPALQPEYVPASNNVVSNSVSVQSNIGDSVDNSGTASEPVYQPVPSSTYLLAPSPAPVVEQKVEPLVASPSPAPVSNESNTLLVTPSPAPLSTDQSRTIDPSVEVNQSMATTVLPPITFEGTFSRDEKVLLQEHILKYFLEGRNPSSIHVRSINSRTLLIEVSYPSGEVSKYRFTHDQNTGKWNVVSL